MRKIGRILGINLLVLLALLLALEAGLRVFAEAPQGMFRGWFAGRLGLYPESKTLPMYGVVNWVVETNRWGFRGADIERVRTPGVWRVAMVGDSVTDGFNVLNADTYPAYTEARLEEQGIAVEVINAANGGSTIDRQLGIFRDAVLPFNPDLVVLTFVTNDIVGLESVEDSQLLTRRADSDPVLRKLQRFLFVYTAVGEFVLDRTLRFISPAYAENQEKAKLLPELPADRYQIPGGDQFQANAQAFMQRYAKNDARLLQDNPDPVTERDIGRYLRALDVFVGLAAERQITPVLVYFPAYPQIYDPSVSLRIRDILQQHCEAKGVAFLDLTPAMREAGAATVLHLAPKDYHLNPAGNRVIARALADFLLARGFLAGSPQPR